MKSSCKYARVCKNALVCKMTKCKYAIEVWWNDLPTPIQNAESLTIHLKTHLFRHHLSSS